VNGVIRGEEGKKRGFEEVRGNSRSKGNRCLLSAFQVSLKERGAHGKVQMPSRGVSEV
jgi:hypothetical protein